MIQCVPSCFHYTPREVTICGKTRYKLHKTDKSHSSSSEWHGRNVFKFGEIRHNTPRRRGEKLDYSVMCKLTDLST